MAYWNHTNITTLGLAWGFREGTYRNRMKLTKLLIITGLGVLLALIIAACGMAVVPPAAAPAPSQAAPGGAASAAATTRNAYPADPRGVVDAFLTDCAANAATDDVVPYVADFRRGDLYAGGAIEFLKIAGRLDSFHTEPALTSTGSTSASVTAVLTVNGSRHVRVLTLISDGGLWHIGYVDTPGE
jgi:hypothetical protein